MEEGEDLARLHFMQLLFGTHTTVQHNQHSFNPNISHRSPQHKVLKKKEGIRMAVPVFGNFEPFKADGVISWEVWQARLEQTFIMSNITTDAEKKDCLLTYLGEDTCKVLW